MYGMVGGAEERRKGVEDGSRTQREMWNEQVDEEHGCSIKCAGRDGASSSRRRR